MRGAWIIALVGCNQIYGLEETKLDPTVAGVDIDADDVDDTTDPCIASREDGLLDDDGDGVRNLEDTCPLYRDVDTTDTDGDGVGNACDPFPGVQGDRLRCMMTFSSIDVNARLWNEHGGDNQWSFLAGNLETLPSADSSILPERDLDSAPMTTLDAYVFVDSIGASSFKLWIRATGAAPSDLACELAGTTVDSTLAVVDAAGTVHASLDLDFPFPAANAFRMSATLAKTITGTNVRCTLSFPMRREVRAAVTLPPGRFGFGFTGEPRARVEALAIYERDFPMAP